LVRLLESRKAVEIKQEGVIIWLNVLIYNIAQQRLVITVIKIHEYNLQLLR